MLRKNKRRLAFFLVLCHCLLCACGGQPSDRITQPDTTAAPTQPVSAGQEWFSRPLNVIDDKYRTYYEVFVYSFYDSDGDGIGDLNGVREKLDYIQDLGCNGIWLMPIMPSTTYHKYDTTDYMAIDPEYGTLEDFKALVSDCHSRGIKLIIDLAMNHSSSKHPWFLQATGYLRTLPKGSEASSAECPYLDYYHFVQGKQPGYTWISGTDWYYESKFWSEMPDLNQANPAVQAEFEAIAKFWMDLGADGFRLDAVKEFESGNDPYNIQILKWFNDYVKSLNPDAYIVCECWMDKVYYSQYYASGVDSMFDFEFSRENGVIANVLNGKYKAASYGALMAENLALYKSFGAQAINAPFYTNHDMGRTAGYYAGEGSTEKTKMGNALNLMMTGNVFLYYGEELGMKGTGKDENKRVGMYWSADTNAAGMCDGPKDADAVKMKFGPLEEQASDPNSVYNYVKQAILLRNQNPAIARGDVIHHSDYSSEKLCVLSKSYDGTELLMVFNTSGEVQSLDLSGLSVQSKAVSELAIIGQLLTGSEAVTTEGNAVTMPPFSIAVFGVE